MAAINPYLNFMGRTEEAFNFYKSIFGGEFPTIMRFKDTAEAPKVAPQEQEQIMHIALPIGNNVLMGTDTLESMGHKLVTGNNITLSVSAKSREEADQIFNGLAAGGHVTGPMKEEFWGAYFGMVNDKFGIPWMVSHDPNYRQA